MSDSKEVTKEIFLHFFYIGGDHKYWSKLQNKIKGFYPDKEIVFTDFIPDDQYNPSLLFHTLLHSTANIIFIDFSTQIDKNLQLAKLLRNDNRMKLCSTVGLFDFLADSHQISRALLAGIRLNHFKGDELSLVIYQAVVFLDPTKAIETKYAFAKVDVEHTLRIDLRMVYCEKDAIRIETSSPLNKGDDVLILKTNKNNKSSRLEFNIDHVQDYNLYYNSRQYCILKPKEENSIKLLLKDKASTLVSNTTIKSVKIYIVDKDLDILANPDFDYKNLPYVFNFQSDIHPQHIVLNRQRPNLIIIQEDETIVTIDHINNLIKTIESLEKYDPYIIVFNYKHSEKISKILNYPHCLSFGEKFTWPLVEKISNSLAKKVQEKPSERFFFSSSNPDTIVKLEKDIIVRGFDEKDIFFQCQDQLPMYTVFSMIYPVKMLVTIVPIPDGSEFSSVDHCYKGLINLVSEDLIQKLRLEINEIFFTEKKKAKEEQKRIQKELKEKYKESEKNSTENNDSDNK